MLTSPKFLGRSSIMAVMLMMAIMAFAAPAVAQVFPAKTVTIVVPYPAGAVTDSLARLLAAQLEKKLGKSVIVDYKPGADGRIGAEYVARSAADGHTVLLASSALPTWPVFFKELSVDPQKDLAPVAMLGEGSFVLAAHQAAPFSTMPEMVAYAKANPGQLNFATLGMGEIKLYSELVRIRAGIDITEVPYKGAEQFTGLIRGDVQLAMLVVSRMLTMQEAGQAKPLAITGKKRAPELPAVPTFSELGLEGFNNYWFALFVPSKTSPRVVAQLNNASLAALKEQSFVEASTLLGVYPTGSTPEELASTIDTTLRHWKSVALTLGIHPR